MWCLESEMSCEPEIMTSDFLYQSINILCLQPQIFLLDWLMFPRSEPECETPNVYITWYSDIFQINVNHSWKWKNIVVPHENLCSIQNSDILYLYWKIIWIAEICYHFRIFDNYNLSDIQRKHNLYYLMLRISGIALNI